VWDREQTTLIPACLAGHHWGFVAAIKTLADDD